MKAEKITTLFEPMSNLTEESNQMEWVDEWSDHSLPFRDWGGWLSSSRVGGIGLSTKKLSTWWLKEVIDFGVMGYRWEKYMCKKWNYVERERRSFHKETEQQWADR
jgi:hypothetical protein